MRPKLVFISSPYRGDELRNLELAYAYCKRLVAERTDVIPFSPLLYVPQLIDERTGRWRALEWCLEFVARSDEFWILGDRLTAGMRDELQCASRLGKPVQFVKE